jgi:hypothetical protein
MVRRTLLALLTLLCLAGGAPGAAATPRVTVATPWTKDDTIGEASRPLGDLRKVEVANGRQRVTFTFRMQAAPVWDAVSTSRVTVMRFQIDWRGTSAPPDRRVDVSRSDGAWRVVVHDGQGGSVCLRDGGVQNLGDHRYRFSVPTGGPVPCLGGAHVLRVASSFRDDVDDSANNDVRIDKVPNNGSYGPFIRLP